MDEDFPPAPIANGALAPSDVPARGAPWWPDIQMFALRFNGYWALGDRACGAYANWVRERTRQRAGRLPSSLSLTGARSCLFFEQRRFSHYGQEPIGEDRAYIDALVSLIGHLAGAPSGRRGASFLVERHAMDVIWAEELERGRHPRRLSKARERAEGCDLLVYADPALTRQVARVEVKGWGEPLLGSDGAFRYGADVNREQYARAAQDPTWRLEIVGNLTQAQAGAGPIQRLSLTGPEVIQRATASKYSVRLERELVDRITHPGP